MKVAVAFLICISVANFGFAQAKGKQVAGFVPDNAADDIFKKADKGKNGQLTDKEFQTAVAMTQQLAASLPPPIAVGGAKKGATAAITPIGNPDLNSDKQISLEEFKAIFPTLIANAQQQVAALRAKAPAAAGGIYARPKY